MKLEQAGPSYSQTRMVELQRQIEQADAQNHKRGRDVYVAPGRLILTAPNGTLYALTVSNTGTLSAVPL